MERKSLGNLALIVVFLLGFGGVSPDTLGQMTISVEPGSRLWITGTSTVSAFTCDASRVDRRAVLPESPEVGAGRELRNTTAPIAHLAVPVNSFDCGRSRMNADFYEALKSDQHEEIQFELTGAEMTDEFLPDGWQLVHAEGRLTIAGETRIVNVVASWRQEEDNRFRLEGSKALTMTSFGVRPPVALLGLVRAHDDIEVHFDLLAEAAGL